MASESERWHHVCRIFGNMPFDAARDAVWRTYMADNKKGSLTEQLERALVEHGVEVPPYTIMTGAVEYDDILAAEAAYKALEGSQ